VDQESITTNEVSDEEENMMPPRLYRGKQARKLAPIVPFLLFKEERSRNKSVRL